MKKPLAKVTNPVAVVLLGTAIQLSAQTPPNYRFTVVVDANGATGGANYASIQAAILDTTRIPPNPTDKWTILIAAGLYAENVVLDDSRENVNLVGLDPDAVIIAPPSGVGVRIEGSGARNNAIRNLTIKAPSQDAGTGISLQRTGSGNDPSDVTIEKVRILAQSSPSVGIMLSHTSNVAIRNCTIDMQGAASPAITLSSDSSTTGLYLIGTTLLTRADDSHAIDVVHLTDGLFIDSCNIETRGARSHALLVRAYGDATTLANARIVNTQIKKKGEPVASHTYMLRFQQKATNLLIRNSNISATTESGGQAGMLIDFEAPAEGVLLEGLQSQCNVQGQQSVGAIDAPQTVGLRLSNCALFAHDYNWLRAGSDTVIENSSLVVTPQPNGAGQAQPDTAAVIADGVESLLIANSKLQGRESGMRLLGNCQNVTASQTSLIGSYYGLHTVCGNSIRLEHCTIVGDSAYGHLVIPTPPDPNPPDYHGVFVDTAQGCVPGLIEFVNCKVTARSGYPESGARGVLAMAAPTTQPVRFRECTISAVLTSTATPRTAKSVGVEGRQANAIELFGGSVDATDAYERESDKFDLLNGSAAGTAVAAYGTRFSKSKGTMGSKDAVHPVVQRVFSIVTAAAASILPAHALEANEVTLTSGFTNPDAFRVLSATGSAPAVTGNVIIIGSDWAGSAITDAITLNGTATVEGKKPFQKVNKIILPPGVSGQTVSVGTTNRLGLTAPISADADVLQVARKSANTAGSFASYTMTDPANDIDEIHATVKVEFSTIIPPLHFEITYRGSS